MIRGAVALRVTLFFARLIGSTRRHIIFQRRDLLFDLRDPVTPVRVKAVGRGQRLEDRGRLLQLIASLLSLQDPDPPKRRNAEKPDLRVVGIAKHKLALDRQRALEGLDWLGRLLLASANITN